MGRGRKGFRPGVRKKRSDKSNDKSSHTPLLKRLLTIISRMAPGLNVNQRATLVRTISVFFLSLVRWLYIKLFEKNPLTYDVFIREEKEEEDETRRLSHTKIYFHSVRVCFSIMWKYRSLTYEQQRTRITILTRRNEKTWIK